MNTRRSSTRVNALVVNTESFGNVGWSKTRPLTTSRSMEPSTNCIARYRFARARACECVLGWVGLCCVVCVCACAWGGEAGHSRPRLPALETTCEVAGHAQNCSQEHRVPQFLLA